MLNLIHVSRILLRTISHPSVVKLRDTMNSKDVDFKKKFQKEVTKIRSKTIRRRSIHIFTRVTVIIIYDNLSHRWFIHMSLQGIFQPDYCFYRSLTISKSLISLTCDIKINKSSFLHKTRNLLFTRFFGTYWYPTYAVQCFSRYSL